MPVTLSGQQVRDDTLTDVDVAAANKDGQPGTACLRTLGTGAQQACAGNDARLSDARAPTGTASGQLGDSYPSPTVRGLRETGGPTLLTLGAVIDGQFLKRTGSTLVGATPAGGSNPSWWGVLYSTGNDCDPLEDLREATMGAIAGPTPTGITTSIARCRLFRPPQTMAVVRVRLFGVGATTNLYKFAIYPRGTGAARLWESGTVTSAANTWLNITVAFSVTGGTEYWFCVTAATTGTTAGFRSMPAPLASNFWGADAAPLGGRGLSLPVFAQFAVTSGAFPATLPAVAAAAYAAGTTGSVPFAWLDSVA